MIPENKLPAVQKALQYAFGTNAYTHIQQLTKGLSSALIYKITVHDKPYLLRVITRDDAMADPAFYYGCMQVAADNLIAPRIHYMDVADRISITDFITPQPFSIAAAKEKLPLLLRDLHALPKFPFRINYFGRIEQFIPQFNAKQVLPEAASKELFKQYARIVAVYPMQDQRDWVASHNDSKPENIVFDGIRPWLVDWEAAFLNDRYLDLNMVGNFVVDNEQEEAAYLSAYFNREASAYEQARYFLMQQVLHFYYFVFLIAFDKGDPGTREDPANERSFRQLHNDMWSGAVELHDNDVRRTYAWLHLAEFQRKLLTPRFEESLKIIGCVHGHH